MEVYNATLIYRPEQQLLQALFDDNPTIQHGHGLQSHDATNGIQHAAYTEAAISTGDGQQQHSEFPFDPADLSRQDSGESPLPEDFNFEMLGSDYCHEVIDAQVELSVEGKPKTATRGSRRNRPKKQRPMLLWQFILQLLLQNHTGLAWSNDQWLSRGVFRFTDTNEVARLWGKYKRNRNMSYEKMSRCIRNYFTRPANKYYGVMLRDGRGKDHKRVHFAFNLDNPGVLAFILTKSPSYYSRLVENGIVRPVQA